jgi:hypothetical protein
MALIESLSSETLGPAECRVLVDGTEIDANPEFTFARALLDKAMVGRVILIPGVGE